MRLLHISKTLTLATIELELQASKEKYI